MNSMSEIYGIGRRTLAVFGESGTWSRASILSDVHHELPRRLLHGYTHASVVPACGARAWVASLLTPNSHIRHSVDSVYPLSCSPKSLDTA